jgi:NAD(P)-dependent dehydrogenase (short-subunit alcohol dehydrogenase family)
MPARLAPADTWFPKNVNVLSGAPAWQHRPVPPIAELQDLTGKVAVVTGGSRGIGRAIVQALAEAGADVVVASRKLDACEAAAAEVHDTTGRRAEAIACHVGRWDDCDRLIAETLDRLDRLDVFVNNAGMSPLYPSLDAVTEDLYDKTFAVNLKGPFRLGVLAGTHMASHGGGAIVNVGTVGSLMASTNELPYACAKAGLNALTVGLADAFAPTVRVNAILPGPFRTDVTKAWPPDMLDGKFVPLGRLGEPEEIAPLAVHLASAASSYTTGAIIRVDGGITRRV